MTGDGDFAESEEDDYGDDYEDEQEPPPRWARWLAFGAAVLAGELALLVAVAVWNPWQLRYLEPFAHPVLALPVLALLLTIVRPVPHALRFGGYALIGAGVLAAFVWAGTEALTTVRTTRIASDGRFSVVAQPRSPWLWEGGPTHVLRVRMEDGLLSRQSPTLVCVERPEPGSARIEPGGDRAVMSLAGNVVPVTWDLKTGAVGNTEFFYRC